MSSKKNFPKEIQKSDEDGRSIPMEVNYNKRSTFLQGSGDLIEEVNRALQMVKRVNTEHQVERTVLGREGVGGTYLKFNAVGYPFIFRVSFCQGNHHRGEIDSLKPNPGDCLCQKDGKDSRTCSDIDGPSLLNPLRHDSFKNSPAGEGHVLSGHPVIIFREFLILDDTAF